MLDEITVDNRGQAESPIAENPTATMKFEEILPFSVGRLRGYLQAAQERQLDIALGGDNGQPRAWLENPWVPLAVSPLPILGRESMVRSGVVGESVEYVVAITNPATTAGVFNLQTETDPGIATAVFDLRPVLAANGSLVFDPMVAVTTSQIVLAPRSLRYLLFRLSPVSADSLATIAVQGPFGWRRVLKVRVRALEIPNVPDVSDPDVVVWAYTNDSPIWTSTNMRKNLEFLRDAGVNVHVIHPAMIPLPGDIKSWEGRERLLRAQLRLYRSAGTVLLYTAWGAHVTELPHRSGKAVQDWAIRLSAIMVEEGYKFDEWAVYPIDEPQGSALDALERTASWLKAAAPEIQVYANPTRASGLDLMPTGGLTRLRGVVDIWQPKLGQAAEVFSESRFRAEDRWWIYKVYQAPAKAVPPQCYREIGRSAFTLGASGLGFWAFSDTAGSSSWDDLDGIRPDWAVVYESDQGIVTSRRWEAFVSGTRDLKILQRCEVLSRQHGEVASPECRLFEAALAADSKPGLCQESAP